MKANSTPEPTYKLRDDLNINKFPKEITSLMAGFEIAVRDHYQGTMTNHMYKKLRSARIEFAEGFTRYSEQREIEAIEALIQRKQLEADIKLLKKDIKHHTLLAKYMKTFLGGDEDALSVKRYIKKLKARLVGLTKDLKEEE